MKIFHSDHWKKKLEYRKEITDDLIEFAIQNSKTTKDKHWDNAFNAVCLMPQNGRNLKAVYRFLGKDKIKIITVYWID